MKRFEKTALGESPVTVWSPPQCAFSIAWPVAVMEEIRAAAVRAFFAIPDGGAEIGGVLFGTRRNGIVRILAARPLECEYALGPTFNLSGTDHARLAALLDADRLDPNTQDWKPVGWYHSHTHSGICLTERDVDIHDRYFPDAWQVALVVRPHPSEPTRAGFFFRESDGALHADSCSGEFLLQPTRPQAERGLQVPPPKRSRWWFW